jgi:hypothetical protein
VTRYLLFTLCALFGWTSVAPTATAQSPVSLIQDLTIGTSTEGRPIQAVRFGNGLRKLVLVGATHGGPEANTYRLMLDVIRHFRDHPEEIPGSVRLIVIPTLNPDGLIGDTRFNSHGVDLNRNMNTNMDACVENDWRPQVNGAYGLVSNTGGQRPETEVESQLIRNFLLDASAAIFYHSAGGELFPPYCEHAPSIQLARAYADVAGYTYTRFYPRYLITGGMHDWAGSMGIASFTPELWNGNDSDTAANLDALHAILDQADVLLPLPADHTVNSVVVPAVFWRYWQSHGGAEFLGRPLAATQQQNGRLIQYFERAILEVHPDARDTTALVQLGLLPAARLGAGELTPQHALPAGEADLDVRFADAWARYGGAAVLGTPTSSVVSGSSLTSGAPLLVQVFERGRLEYDPLQSTVRLSPVGWQAWHVAQVHAPIAVQQIR